MPIVYISMSTSSSTLFSYWLGRSLVTRCQALSRSKVESRWKLIFPWIFLGDAAVRGSNADEVPFLE